RPQGTGTLSFLWEFNGRTHTGQVFQLFDRLTGENFLPTDPDVYVAHLTVTDERGETYTEDVSIEILPEDAKLTIPCESLEGTCTCPEGRECLEENRITGATDCQGTCCKCTPKTPTPNTERPPQEELDRNCYKEGTTFVDLPGNPFTTRDVAASALSGCYDLCGKNYLQGTAIDMGDGQWWAGCCCRPETEPIPVPCRSRGGSCTCHEGEECLEENKITGATDCPDTCCRCTSTTGENVLHIVYVPLGYDMATQSDDFGMAVAISSHYFLEKTPFRECKNKEDLVKFHRLTEPCPLAEYHLRLCDNEMFTELKKCVFNSPWATVANSVQGVYNGNIGNFCIGTGFSDAGTDKTTPLVASFVSSTYLPKTSVHELGHDFGLPECDVGWCVMKRGGSGTEFCSHCYAELKEKLDKYLVRCQR
ncbi:MAG: hypothetical protein JW724_01400, partial [Candidatus Altiarchaeota archaeon]|nr:hypothetical protein [Candidatus Altiarchaeota archaeon]